MEPVVGGNTEVPYSSFQAPLSFLERPRKFQVVATGPMLLLLLLLLELQLLLLLLLVIITSPKGPSTL